MEIKIGIPHSVLVFFLAVFVICLFFILYYKRERFFRWTAWLILGEYVILTFFSTVLFRKSHNVVVNRTVCVWLDKPDFPVPAIYEPILNILLFVPIGFLIGYLIKDCKLLKTAALGFFISFMIEFMQFYFRRGISSVDDILNNTVGSAVGCLVLLLLQLCLRPFTKEII